MKPLLAHIYEPHRITYPCYIQPKLNGIRALYQNGRFQSRDEIPFAENLLAHLSKPLLRLFGPEVILDGELYKHGWPLQRINGAVTPVRQESNEDTLQVEYHVFDRVHFELSFIDRIHLFSCESLKLEHVWTTTVYNEQEADLEYAAFVADGYEGMMYRLGDCPYTVPKQPRVKGSKHSPGNTKFLSDKDNRCWHLLKRKDWQDDEFVCVDLNPGEGKLTGTLGAFVCQTKSNSRFAVGSGLTDSERAHYWANPPIGKLIKVKYLVLSSDGIPLNPTILAIL